MKFLEIPPDICRNVCGTSNTAEPNVFKCLVNNLISGRLCDPDIMSDLRGLAERQILFRRLSLPSFNYDGAVQSPEVLHGYLSHIRTFSPYIVKALPIYLYAIALHIIDTGVSPPRIPGGILPMGSSITPHMKRIIERAFGCRIHEDYGCSELGSIGAECGRQNGIHPFSSLFYVEVVRQGQPAAPGELGRVLITDLTNYAMPFIRYEIGDVAVVRNGSCPCGLTIPRLDIQGRIQDCLPGGKELISSDAVADALFACPGVRLFQLQMTGVNQADLQIVPEPHVTPDYEQIKTALLRMLQRPLHVVCRTVPTILPEASGKFRLVKNLTAKGPDLI
jgi:phenylacetate-CoA ligase